MNRTDPNNIIEGLKNIIISFYAKGMSVSDIEEQIKELYDFGISLPFSDYKCGYF
uniref:hypothetical protein n=1 Tax=Chryseobacterium binzhouense TaxID=2593646 RepID=UPI00289CACBE|nr:hypothetical protein [Chryseobacterium binzhouense]